MRLYLAKRAGRGGFSRVYVARVVTSSSSSSSSSGAVVAVKKMHITKHTPNSVLRHEACAYLLLAGHPSVPEVYAWGRSQYYDYLALELLGDDVHSVRKGLTLRNFAVIACAMLDAIEHVHKHGLVHCDIKPSNFLFTADHRTLKLIDFGLATLFLDARTGAHVPECTTSGLRGTERYASIHAHMHRTPARRDDLISLSYTLAELQCGRLPWNDDDSRKGDTLKLKAAWTGAALRPPLAAFVQYAGKLEFAAEPEYASWRAAFRALVPGLPPDAVVFDPADDGPRLSLSDADEHSEVADGDDGLEVPGSLPQVDGPGPASVESDEIPDSDDGWVPADGTWPPPMSVGAADLIGDEQATVRARLEHVEAPPAMDEPWLLCCDSPEAMLPL